MLPDLNNPEVREVTSEAQALAAAAAGYAVKTADQYAAAGEELRRVKSAQKRLEDVRKSITRPIDAAKKAVMDLFRDPETKLAAAESGIKAAMVKFSDEQERIRQEEQRRLEEIARREREKLAAQAAEAERKAREKAEVERLAAESAAAAGRHEEAAKLAAKAAAIEERSAAKVDALQMRAATVVAPVIQSEAPKVAGTSTREEWRWEVVDADAVPREYLVVDEVKLGRVVRALKGDAKIPGVRIYPVRGLAARAG